MNIVWRKLIHNFQEMSKLEQKHLYLILLPTNNPLSVKNEGTSKTTQISLEMSQIKWFGKDWLLNDAECVYKGIVCSCTLFYNFYMKLN